MINEPVDPLKRSFSILARVAANRACVYRWLALGFYPPDEALWEAVRTRRIYSELEQATAWLCNDRERLSASSAGLARSAPDSVVDMQATYAQLFGKGVERVSLCEATYRWRDPTRLLRGAADLKASLLEWYRQFGLAPDPGQEDRVAVELEFAAYLCEREAANWTAHLAGTARELRRQEHAFISDHLGCWLPDLCWRVAARAPGSFYTCLAGFCDCWLGLEQGPGYHSAVDR